MLDEGRRGGRMLNGEGVSGEEGYGAIGGGHWHGLRLFF
jgi:hypothetical protein